MKSIISYLLLLFLINCYGQISITPGVDAKLPPPLPAPVKKIPPYDSSFNYSSTDYFSLIGQTIYFLPASTKYKTSYLQDYSTNFTTEVPTKFQNPPSPYLAPYTEVSIYKPVYFDEKPNYRTSLKEVQGRYFKITGFTEDGKYIKLKDVNNSNDSLLYQMHELLWDPIIDYVIVGYFIREREAYLNHHFYLNDAYVFGAPSIDVVSGETILLSDTNERWKCYDVTFLETTCYYYPILALLLTNSHGARITLKLSYMKPIYSSSCKSKEFMHLWEFTDEKDVRRKGRLFEASMIKRFGPKYGELIIQHKVDIGMTDEMCDYAWDKPNEIHYITKAGHKIEKWIYKSRTDLTRLKHDDANNTGWIHGTGDHTMYTKALYFENDKLIEIEE